MRTMRAFSTPRGARGVSSLKAGVSAKVCAILGAQWGDEGKGKLADVLAKKCGFAAITRPPCPH